MFYRNDVHLHLHSFPTRRSSDLYEVLEPLTDPERALDPSSPPLHPSGNLLRHVPIRRDRRSTRLNSSHVESSYAVFCLKKKMTRLLASTKLLVYLRKCKLFGYFT